MKRKIYIYVGRTGYNPRIGQVFEGQEFDYLEGPILDELLRNGLVKIKTDEQPKIKTKQKTKE